MAVVAHSGKNLGGGLSELRKVLAEAGHKNPIWYEVPKSSGARKAVHRAVKKGAKLIFVWGGDGMVQRCVDALAGSRKVAMAILPAGTANLLATNVGIPKDIAQAVHIGLVGTRRKIDVGTMNGERFAVMAGVGFDAIMMHGVDGAKKRRFGRLAYIRSGVDAMQANRVRMAIRVDGAVWFKGKASAAVIGNVGTVTGGLVLFPAASPSDGVLEVGVVTANSTWQWIRVFSRIARGHLDRSPFIEMTHGKEIVIELARKVRYELDGGARPPAKRLEIRVRAGAITLCVPADEAVKRPVPFRARASDRRRASSRASRPIPPSIVPSAVDVNRTGPRRDAQPN